MSTFWRITLLFYTTATIYLTDFFEGLLWQTRAEISPTDCSVDYHQCFTPYGFSIDDFVNAWPH